MDNTSIFEMEYHENKSGGSMPNMHTHNAYEIYYLHEGKRSYIIDNKVYEIFEGCVALIPPNVFHKTSGENFKRTLISFSYSFLRDYFTHNAVNSLLSCFSSQVIILNSDEQSDFCRLCSHLSDYAQKGTYDIRPVILANMLILLGNHTASENYKPMEASDKLLSEILYYISQNYKTIETLDEIAQKFYITKFHLCRKFKENTGMSVFHYINTLKLQQACKLLSSGEGSITDICMECGFNSQTYFCKAFRTQIGMTPSDYRKMSVNSKII